MLENSGGYRVDVIRSTRRKKSSQARFIGDNTIEIRLPAGLTPEQEEETVSLLVSKISKRVRAVDDDQELNARAAKLNEAVLAGRARFSSVRWVSNQSTRWASCSPGTGEIRVSDRLKHVPDYVLDAVLVHELVHTFVPGGHSETFWEYADRAPKAERAKGYLEAFQRFG